MVNKIRNNFTIFSRVVSRGSVGGTNSAHIIILKILSLLFDFICFVYKIYYLLINFLFIYLIKINQ